MDNSEIRRRQQKRRIDRKKRQERQKKLRRRLFWGSAAAVLLAALVITVFLLADYINQPPAPGEDTPGQTSPQASQEQTVINLAFGGDLNVTDKVITAGSAGDGYDYTDIFTDILPLLAGADGSAVNFEGNLCGAPYGTQDTRAPQALADALSDAGVDYLQMANSCALNNGLLGLQSTLENIRKAGLEPVGAFADKSDFTKHKGFTLRSIHGVKVAFVAFTKGMDSLSLPAGSEDCVNLLYTDYTSTYQDVDTEGITKILKDVAAEKPDVTVALVHWGSEYNRQISGTQEKIAKLMQQQGVDAIIGTHSHYVQKLSYDPKAGTVVAYSLGDFLGDGEKSGTAYSIVLNLEFTKNNATGETKLTDCRWDPIYTTSFENDGVARMQILQIRPAVARYEADGINKVSEETYTAMKSALSKLEATLSEEE